MTETGFGARASIGTLRTLYFRNLYERELCTQVEKAPPT
jgi:hypothetical protein